MNHFWEIFLFFLPAFVANAVPVIVMNIPGIRKWDTPVWERFLGKNKTWRGFIFGIGCAIAVGGIQFWIGGQDPFFGLMWGGLLGIGALGGDSVESFVKRRMNIVPGQALPFWDGVDYIIGALLLGCFMYIPNLSEVFFLIIIGPILSFLSNVLAYVFKLKKVWY